MKQGLTDILYSPLKIETEFVVEKLYILSQSQGCLLQDLRTSRATFFEVYVPHLSSTWQTVPLGKHRVPEFMGLLFSDWRIVRKIVAISFPLSDNDHNILCTILSLYLLHF